MSRCGSLSLSYLELLNFFDVYIHVFHQIWDIFSHYFFKYFVGSFCSLFLLGLLQCIVIHLMYPKLLGFWLLFNLFFFLFLILNNFHCLIFQCHNYFFYMDNLPLNLAVIFFISVIVLFRPRIFVFRLSFIYIYILNKLLSCLFAHLHLILWAALGWLL